jgi:hypothetical protein
MFPGGGFCSTPLPGLFSTQGPRAARILDKLRQSPFSVEELSGDLKRNAAGITVGNTTRRSGGIMHRTGRI